MKLVTIIIPVYNTPQQYLNRLINSLKEQTNMNYEVFIIDDGSEKECSEYLDALTKKNSFLTVYHKINEGVSKARNYGIQRVKTQYVAFMDADDKIANCFIEDGYYLIEKYFPDIIYGGMEYVPYREIKQSNSHIEVFEGRKELEEIKKSLLNIEGRRLKYNILGTPCSRFYRTDLAKAVKFNESLHFYEDQIFNREILSVANKVVVSPNVWYYYYQNDFSAMNKERKDNFFEKTKKYWDVFYKLNTEEPDSYRKSLRKKQLDFFYAVISNDFIDNEVNGKRILSQLNKIAKHPMIEDSINNLRYKDGNLYEKINLFFLKKHCFYFIYLEKKLIKLMNLEKKL